MKSFAAIALVMVLAAGARAQTAPPAASCLNQYDETTGRTTAGLLTAGYNIVAAVPGGVWLQKDREAYYCNSARVREGEAICWRLREPSKAACQ